VSCFRKPVCSKEQKREDRMKYLEAQPGSPQLAH
jgi:hypothetical protein